MAPCVGFCVFCGALHGLERYVRIFSYCWDAFCLESLTPADLSLELFFLSFFVDFKWEI